MTKPHKISEVDLSDLYQKRKQKHQSPSSVKRSVMSHSRQDQHWRPIFNRIGAVAIAASTLLLIALVTVHQGNLNKPVQTGEYTFVELHSLDQQVNDLASNVRARYAEHYNDYLKQKQILARHHKKAAVLNLYEDGWELTTCDQELVKISNELVLALQKIDKVGTQFSNGDFVDIEFDKNGIIIGIQQSPRYQHC